MFLVGGYNGTLFGKLRFYETPPRINLFFVISSDARRASPRGRRKRISSETKVQSKVRKDGKGLCDFSEVRANT